MSDDDNVFRLGAIPGGKKTDDEGIPINDYVIIDIDDHEYAGTGFMIFTSHHLAIMRDNGKGAVPVLVLPIGRVKAAEIYEDDDEDVAPF